MAQSHSPELTCQPDADLSASYYRIDPKIDALVQKLNQTGVIQTVASCQGHGKLGKPPYVYFKAPVEVAARLEQTIRTAIEQETHSLSKYWVIEGRFNHFFELLFMLYCPKHDETAFTLKAPFSFWLYRRKLDQDLAILCKLVDESFAAKPSSDWRCKDTPWHSRGV